MLEFLDPHCTDICPTVSDEFTDAYPSGRERYLASPQADHSAAGASYLPADQIAAGDGESRRSPGSSWTD